MEGHELLNVDASVDTPAPETTQPEVHPIDLLVALNRVNKDESAFRADRLKEIAGLVRLLERNEADGITFGALGGLQLAINQLQASFGCKPLPQLEEIYAKDQLASYPSGEVESQRTCFYYHNRGLQVMIDKVHVSEDLVRFRIYSPVDQTDKYGQKYFKGDLFRSTDREYPPLSELHKHPDY